MQRYFSKDKKDNKLLINQDDLYHIKKVMRMKNKENIEVVYLNELYICEVDLDNNYFNILEKKMEENEFKKDVTIAFPILKEDKINLIIQKCTELGVNNFIPVKMERCVIKVLKDEDKKINRWKRIVKEASEQSKRNIIPNIENIINLDQLAKKEYDLKILCSLHTSSKSLKKVLQYNTKCDKIIMVFGPEGGFTSNEEELLINQGFIRTSLGQTIKRTETAPIYVMSVIGYEFLED